MTLKGARRLAHEALMCRHAFHCQSSVCPTILPGADAVSHTEACDRVTAVIEARDAQHAAEVERLREALSWWIDHAGEAFPIKASKHRALVGQRDPGAR